MAKGLYLTSDGQVLVEYGKRRVPAPSAQYKAKGYKPPCDKLPPKFRAKRARSLPMPRPEGRPLLDLDHVLLLREPGTTPRVGAALKLPQFDGRVWA